MVMGPLSNSDLHLLFLPRKQSFNSMKHPTGIEGNSVHFRFMKCDVIKEIITKEKGFSFVVIFKAINCLNFYTEFTKLLFDFLGT